MIEIMQREASTVDLNGLVEKLTNEAIGREIEKHAGAIYPLQNVLIRKVKVVRSAKMDSSKLVELAGGVEALATASSADIGKRVVEAVKEQVGKVKKGKAGAKDEEDGDDE